MARWLSSAQIRRQAKWEWDRPIAVGAIAPPIVVSAEMVAPTLNNGAVDPNVSTAVASMPAPIIRVDTGTNAPPPLTSAGAMQNPGLKTVFPTKPGTAASHMVAPIVWKTIVCYPTPCNFTLHGSGPAIPTGTAKFPTGATLIMTGSAPGVSSVTPTRVTPSPCTFTLAGSAPTLPTGPRFGNYTFPITLN